MDGTGAGRRTRCLAPLLLCYQANVAQTEHALFGIRWIASIVAGASFLAVAICLLFYRIDKNLNLIIPTTCERRKGYSSAARSRCFSFE